MRVRCNDCNQETEFNLDGWRCGCNGAWELAILPPFDSKKIRLKDYSIWRYGKLLGLDLEKPLKRMGVGWTPLVPANLFDVQTYMKLEYLSPSGSFKDRGINTMINQLVHMGVQTVVEDSSGNAGASLAAHAARFGIDAQIFVPGYASLTKIHQIKVYGADVKQIPGPRRAAEEAAQASIGLTRAYASHAYNPAYLAGQVTASYELWEQLGEKSPDWIICPVAQGGLFLGYYFGFLQLLKAGLISHLPRLVAVQSAQVAPIHQAWSQGLDDIPAVQATGPTIAEGVTISQPVRQKRLLEALRETHGTTLSVEENDIKEAQTLLAKLGYYVEPTSALVVAGLKLLKNEIDRHQIVVLPLTGNGLKGVPQNNGYNIVFRTVTI